METTTMVRVKQPLSLFWLLIIALAIGMLIIMADASMSGPAGNEVATVVHKKLAVPAYRGESVHMIVVVWFNHTQSFRVSREFWNDVAVGEKVLLTKIAGPFTGVVYEITIDEQLMNNNHPRI